MGSPLNTGGGNGPRNPSLKLLNVGDYADFAVVDAKEIPRYEFGTKNVKLNQAGEPMKQNVLTVIVLGGASVTYIDKTTTRPVEKGEVANIFFAGFDRWDGDADEKREGDVGRSFMGACDHVGGLQVGDVGRWKFEASIPGKGAQPRKVRTVQIRRPKPEEAEQAERCEALRLASNSTALATADSGGPF